MPECHLGRLTATLRDGSTCTIPYWTVDSGRDGEVFLVSAAQHGNEVQGCEVIARFRDVCSRDLIAGRVYLLPFANPLALRHRRSHSTLGPEQPYGDDSGENMNRTWPGNPDGNDTERLAYAIHEGVVRHCTKVLDLHSWSRFTATCALVRADCENSTRMGEASAIRFVHEMPRPAPASNAPIGVPFNNDGRGALCIELAPQWVIREKEVFAGLRAATNIARLFGMMDGDPEPLDGPQVRFNPENRAERSHQVRAPRSGLFVETGLETSDYVEQGQKLGHLICDGDLEIIEFFAPVSGYLWQYGCHRQNSDVSLPAMHPWASEGDLLATVMV